MNIRTIEAIYNTIVWSSNSGVQQIKPDFLRICWTIFKKSKCEIIINMSIYFELFVQLAISCCILAE